MATSPSFEQFSELAKTARVVPVTRALLADSLTPVVAKATLGNAPGTFLLESVVGGEKWGRYSFVGFEPRSIVRGVADRFETIDANGLREQRGVDPWECLRAAIDALACPHVPGLPRFFGGAVGYVAYDSVRRFEPKVGAALDASSPWEFEFGLGATLLAFDNVKQTVTIIVPAVIEGDVRAAYDAANARLDRAASKLANPVVPRPLAPPDRTIRPELPASSFDEAGFRAAIEVAKEHIRAGDIFQVVLSQRFEIPQGDVELFDVYRMMRQLNPSPYMYLLEFDDVTIAGASPETLVRMEDGVATVRPIAGTRPRGRDEHEDAVIGEELLADPKERAEHVMLVDLGRNDVGRISAPGTVKLTDRMIIERYSHVMHIVSNVEGRLAEGRDALDVLRATFPAGTLSGAPKVRAMQIIEDLEPVRRDIYGGAVGYVGFDGNMDVAIAIRTIVARGGRMFLQAGAGIVEASDPGAEYQETVNKARAALVAVEAARRATK